MHQGRECGGYAAALGTSGPVGQLVLVDQFPGAVLDDAGLVAGAGVSACMCEQKDGAQ